MPQVEYYGFSAVAVCSVALALGVLAAVFLGLSAASLHRKYEGTQNRLKSCNICAHATQDWCEESGTCAITKKVCSVENNTHSTNYPHGPQMKSNMKECGLVPGHYSNLQFLGANGGQGDVPGLRGTKEDDSNVTSAAMVVEGNATVDGAVVLPSSVRVNGSAVIGGITIADDDDIVRPMTVPSVIAGNLNFVYDAQDRTLSADTVKIVGTGKATNETRISSNRVQIGQEVGTRFEASTALSHKDFNTSNGTVATSSLEYCDVDPSDGTCPGGANDGFAKMIDMSAAIRGQGVELWMCGGIVGSRETCYPVVASVASSLFPVTGTVAAGHTEDGTPPTILGGASANTFQSQNFHCGTEEDSAYIDCIPDAQFTVDDETIYNRDFTPWQGTTSTTSDDDLSTIPVTVRPDGNAATLGCGSADGKPSVYDCLAEGGGGANYPIDTSDGGGTNLHVVPWPAASCLALGVGSAGCIGDEVNFTIGSADRVWDGSRWVLENQCLDANYDNYSVPTVANAAKRHADRCFSLVKLRAAPK